MAKFHVTARTGSEAQRLTVDSIEEALDTLEAWVKMTVKDGPLGSISAIREYGPDQRVKSRIQIAQGKIWRGKVAGIDVMGDLRCVPYRGSVNRVTLTPQGDENPFEVVRRYFAEAGVK